MPTSDDRVTDAPGAGPRSVKRRRLLVGGVAVLLVAALGIGVFAAVHPGTPAASPSPTPLSLPNATGYPYSSDEFGFSATFSGKPTEIANDQVIGEATIHVGSVQFSSADAAEIISSAPMPDATVAMDRDEFLTNAFSSAVANVAGATAGPVTFFELKGERAIEGTFTTTVGETANVVATMHNGVQFLIIDGSTAAAHTAFIDSFDFIG